MIVSTLKCLASFAGFAVLFSAGLPSAAQAQEPARAVQKVSCRPIDARGGVLPFLPTDATVKCEIFLLWQQDCKQSASYDPTGAFHAGYCLAPRSRELGRA